MSDPQLIAVSGLDFDRAGVRRFDAWAHVFADVAGEALEGDHDERSAAELRTMAGNPSFERQGWVAVESGEVVGAATLVLPLRDNVTHSFGRVAVVAGSRGSGLGTRLADHLERAARASGRHTLQAQTHHRPGVPDAGEGFARARGYAPAQRLLRGDLAVDAVAPPSPVQPGYRLETVVGRVPDAWFAAYASFQMAMATDAPAGDLALGAEAWDSARVASHLDRVAAMGRSVVVTMAFTSAGEPVGITEVQHAEDLGELAYQQDTLVVAAHRGHGLGLALKSANAAAVRSAWPGVRRIRTWNADDNAAMLAVNSALGCVPTPAMTSALDPEPPTGPSTREPNGPRAQRRRLSGGGSAVVQPRS